MSRPLLATGREGRLWWRGEELPPHQEEGDRFQEVEIWTMVPLKLPLCPWSLLLARVCRSQSADAAGINQVRTEVYGPKHSLSLFFFLLKSYFVFIYIFSKLRPLTIWPVLLLRAPPC